MPSKELWSKAIKLMQKEKEREREREREREPPLWKCDAMNTATNFVKNAVLKYGERYIDTGRFRPVVHVMWIIGKRLATPFTDLVRGGIEKTNWNDALLSSFFFFQLQARY